MELLSPAGSMECLIAAVQNGADAVYFGGGSFNARRYADNFAGDAMVRAVDYCHERGVRAYITLNTLIFDREMGEALDFAAELYHIGADAVLVQDIGLARAIRCALPELTLHASTQMGIHDLGGLQFCARMGLSRAVLARETSLEWIKYLASNSKIELEAFAHGALCMSFSGSCLFSSMSGERSGNRGTCAQPCRKRASVRGLPDEDDFCLSPNDICMLEHLKQLQNAGVACVKLEGRMKKPEYVATVTRAYRAALDGAGKSELMALKNKLFVLFNRGGFSTAHYFGDSVRTDRVGSSKPDKEIVLSAKNSMRGENKRRFMDMELRLRVGENALLSAKCLENCVRCTGAVVQRAERPQSAEVYASRLRKLGDTPFAPGNCTVSMDENCYISIAELNVLRRAMTDAMLQKFHVRHDAPCHEALNAVLVPNSGPCVNADSNNGISTELNSVPDPLSAPILDSVSRSVLESSSGRSIAGLGKNVLNEHIIYVRVTSANAARLAFENGADIVAFEPVEPESERLSELRRYVEQGRKLVLALPNVLISRVQQDEILRLIESGLFVGAEANNIGQTDLIKDMSLRIAGIGMNALNSYTVWELLNLGYDYVMPSPELTGVQLMALSEKYGDRLFVGIHGRTPLMQLLHCPVKEHGGCRHCAGDAGCVTDEAGRKFPLVNTKFSDKCLVRMFNCRITDLIDISVQLPPCAGFVLSFTGEPDEMIADRLSTLIKAQNGEKVAQLPDATRGHYNRRVE